MSEMIVFLKNLSITVAVIAVPVMCIWLIERYKLNRVKKTVEEIPTSLKSMLVAKDEMNHMVRGLRIRYAMRNVGKGIALYGFITIFGILRLGGEWAEIKEYLTVSLFFLAVIACLVMRDALRVAPWRKLQVIKAVECNDQAANFRGDQYILYYDYKKETFSVSKMKIGQNVLFDDNGCLMAVVAEKRKCFSPIFVIEDRKNKEK